MIDPTIQLGEVVIAFTAPDPNGSHLMGVMIGHYDCPTVLIDCGDGVQHAWALHLCREATPAQAREYWRKRALAAEEKLRTT